MKKEVFKPTIPVATIYFYADESSELVMNSDKCSSLIKYVAEEVVNTDIPAELRFFKYQDDEFGGN